MGAVEEPEVPWREPQWNERATAMRRENAGVYRLLCVNVCGIKQLRGRNTLRELFCVNAAVAVRELAENTASGIGGGSTLRSVARQGSALRSDRWRGTAWP